MACPFDRVPKDVVVLIARATAKECEIRRGQWATLATFRLACRRFARFITQQDLWRAFQCDARPAFLDVEGERVECKFGKGYVNVIRSEDLAKFGMAWTIFDAFRLSFKMELVAGGVPRDCWNQMSRFQFIRNCDLAKLLSHFNVSYLRYFYGESIDHARVLWGLHTDNPKVYECGPPLPLNKRQRTE